MTSPQVTSTTIKIKSSPRQEIMDKLNSHSRFRSPWLWKLFILALLGNTCTYFLQYSWIFTSTKSQFSICLPHQLIGNLKLSTAVNFSYPTGDEGCFVFDDQLTDSDVDDDDAIDAVVEKCLKNGGKFKNFDQKGESFVKDFEIGCDGGQLLSEIWTKFFIGSIIGSVALGFAGDIFGRKKTVIISFIPFSFFSYLLSMSPSANFYSLTFMTVAFFAQGISNILQVHLIENLSGCWREISAICFNAGVALSFTILYIFAEISKGWREILMMSAIFGLIVMVLMITMIESPDYLLNKGNLNRAHQEVFGVETPENLIDDEAQISLNYFEILKSTLIIAFFVTFCWFNFHIVTSRIDESDFGTVNSAIRLITNDLIGLIVMTFAAVLMSRRSVGVVAVLIMSFATILGLSAEEKNEGFYFNISRSCSTPILAFLPLWLCEVVPTRIRSAAMGIVVASGMLVGVFAEEILDFFDQTFVHFDLRFLYAFFVTSTILLFLLPETKSQRIVTNFESEEKPKKVKFVPFLSFLVLLLVTAITIALFCQRNTIIEEN